MCQSRFITLHEGLGICFVRIILLEFRCYTSENAVIVKFKNILMNRVQLGYGIV